MTDEPEQPTERTQAAARAARRARRIGGRSTPDAAPQEETPDAASPDAASPDAASPDASSPDASPAAEPEPAQAPETEPTAETAPAPERPAAAVRLSKPAGSAEPTAEPGAVPARSGWRAWLPAFVLALVCLGFLGWGAYDSHGVWWARSSSSVADERGPVLSAAKSCMSAMNTYDYRKLAESEAKGVACTTGTFTGQYKQAFEKLIKPQAGKVEFTQTAQINNAGVESVSGDGQQWVVLVYGQLSTTNSQTGTKAPTLTPFSARVTMQHVGDKWLVANYQYAPTS